MNSDVKADKLKVLQIGPDPLKSKGGMTTVISGIVEAPDLQKEFDIEAFASFRDGNIVYRLLFNIFAYIRFLLIYRKYDIFHIHIASNGSTFRKAFYIRRLKKSNKKVICHIHGASYIPFYEKLDSRKKIKVTETLNSADALIVLSDDWKDKLEKICGFKHCISIPNGINEEQFEKAVSDFKICKNTFVFLGRFGARKGVYDLINAVQKLISDVPDIKLYLAGDGEIEKVRQMIKSKGLDENIHVMGWVDFDGKIALMKKCATVVLPSYNEGLPMAILEAMASGKVIISTTVGAIPEVVKPENGFLIAPGDIDALASAMKKCAEGGDSLEAIPAKNIEKIRSEYSEKIMHSRIAALYDSLSQ